MTAKDAQNVENSLRMAIALHKDGRLPEARSIYEEILRSQPTHFNATYCLAVSYAQNNDFDMAAKFFSKAAQLNPRSVDAHVNCGLALHSSGHFHKAIECYDRAIQLAPSLLDAHYNRGAALGQLKRLPEALIGFERAIHLKPDYAEAHYFHGKVLSELNRNEEALQSYDRAIRLNQNYAEAYSNRGNALNALNRREKALKSYDLAVQAKPDFADAYYNRGIVLNEMKRFEEALGNYEHAIRLRPDYMEAHLNRGGALIELKRFEAALESYNRLSLIKPDYAEAYSGRGLALAGLRRFEEALQSYDRAIRLKPDFAEAFSNRGNALRELKRFEEALQSYDRAIQLKQVFSDAWFNAGNMYFELNCHSKAIDYLEKAIELAPNESKALFASCFAELPILYRAENEIPICRDTYERKLRLLCDDLEKGRLKGDLAESIAAKTPFYLAYQGHCDLELQTLYGALVCKIMQSKYPASSLPPPPAPGEPLRVGFVSHCFYNHSNWKIPLKGWMSQLDRARFKVYGYYFGEYNDVETEAAASMCERFARGLKSVDDARQEIQADAPHVLVYPGLLMDSLSLQLAAQRLAPVQCNSWGHPETSGMPTLDYFLSSDLMEPPDASEHYSEQLIRLPNLSIYYAPPTYEKIAKARADFGLRSGATVFWCGQSLFKYLPRFDYVFAEIAAHVEDCQFVFLRHLGSQNVTEHFTERLGQAFQRRNLNYADHCVVLPRLNYDDFICLIGQCDLVLDSIGWSGCNSTLECLEFNLPIVTFQGSLMRGRHSAAILRRMGVFDTTATTMENYVSIAVQLANDPSKRTSVSRRIADNKDKIYRDSECISAFEEFLRRAAGSISFR